MEPSHQAPEIPPAITQEEFDARARLIYEQMPLLVSVQPRQLREEMARLDGEIGDLHVEVMRQDCQIDYVQAREAIDRLRASLRFNARLNRHNHIGVKRPRWRRN